MANHYNTSNKTIAMRGPSLWETRAAFLIVAFYVVKLLVKSVCETAPKSLSCPPPPLPPCTRIWVRALIINFLIKFKGNSKRISGKSLSPRKFQNNDIRELKQGRRRRQRERQKSDRFKLAKKQLCTWITLFCTFLCRHCMTTTWKCLISRFLGDVNTRRRLCFPFPELRHCPLAIEFNSRKIYQHLKN